MPPKCQIIWDYGSPNVQINFGLKNHIFCTFQIIWAAQIILGCTNYFGMHKLFITAQIILNIELDNIVKFISNVLRFWIHKDSIDFHRILMDPEFYGFLKNPLTVFKDLSEFHKVKDSLKIFKI